MERELQIQNRLGLHARTASDFARCAARFESTIQIEMEGRRISARSAMDILEAGLAFDRRFKLIADGPDAEVAIRALEIYLRHLAQIDHQDPTQFRSYRMQRAEQVVD